MEKNMSDHDPRDDEFADDDTRDETAADEATANALQITQAGSVVALIERATLEQMVVTAKQFPRSAARAIKAITTLAVLDEETAQECLYTLPRGKKPIVGPSIRFAELVKQCWGNCASESEPTHVDLEGGYVHSRGVFIDYETHAITRKTTRRRIVDSRGRLYNEDMQTMTANAACAIAERNAILAGIPKPVWRRAYADVLKLAAGSIETFTASRDKALKSFATFGVTGDMVLGALGLKGVDDMTLEHIPVIRGMYATLKNGEETVETMFDPRQGRPFQAVKNPLQDEQPGPVDEGGRTDRAQEGAGNGQGGGQGASGAKPAGEQRTQGAAQQAAAQANADPKPTKTGEAMPSNDPEYRIFATAWIAAGKSVSGVNDRWKRERGLRDDCKVEARTTDDLIEARDTKINELREAAK